MGSAVLSSIFGWVSLACWIVVYSPQIHENYKRQSGQGLSVLFVVTWLIGDLCSLIGAMLAHLLPTVIILSLYYSVCDTTLLFQIYYYQWKTSHISDNGHCAPTEDTPLIREDVPPVEKRPSLCREFIKYATALLFVFATGITAWALDQRVHGDGAGAKPDEVFEWKSQLLGWTSAILFLGARVPQILKNFKTKCEGLSPALFVFSISGNTTYALSICFASTEPRYLWANASWLAGSVLTIFLDLFVIGQFVYYRNTANVAH